LNRVEDFLDPISTFLPTEIEPIADLVLSAFAAETKFAFDLAMADEPVGIFSGIFILNNLYFN